MSWRKFWGSGEEHKMDDDGNFDTQSEFEEAVGDGSLKCDGYGTYYDPDSGDEYWNDGTKKN